MNHRVLLSEALRQSQARNPLFSLRAMAKQLSMSSAHLSQLLSGKRPLTLRIAMKIGDALDLPNRERQHLISAAQANQKKGGVSAGNIKFQSLQDEEFSPISDWYYFAILSMGKLRGNRASARWISDQLGIGFAEAKAAYEKLKALGYIEESDGKFRQCSRPVHSSRDVPSFAIRKYHKQNLDKAKDKLDLVPIDLRDYSSITMAVDAKKLSQAKKMIHAFKVKLFKYLDSSAADDVYTLAIQLFPVTKSQGDVR